MTEPFSPDGPRQYLADLCHLVRERASAEVDITEHYALAKEEGERLFQQSQRSLTVRYHADKATAEEEYNTSKESIAATFDSEYSAAEEEYEKVRSTTRARCDTEREAAQQELQDARWEVTAMSEAARGGSNLQVKDIIGGLEKRWQELHAIDHERVVGDAEFVERLQQLADDPIELKDEITVGSGARLALKLLRRERRLMHGLRRM